MVESNKPSAERAPKHKAALFSLPRAGSSLLLSVEQVAVFTLYFAGYGLDSSLAAFALAAGYLTIAASQFLFGWISDHISTRIGRRKPFLLIFAPLLSISFIFLVLPRLVLPDLNDKNILFTWLLIWDVIFRICYAVTTPYQAWLAEQFSVNERPKVSQYQNIFNYVGNAILAILTITVYTTDKINAIAANVNAVPLDLLISTIVAACIAVTLFYITAFFLPIEPYREIKSDLLQSLKLTLKNRNFLKIVLMQGISGFAWSIITAVMLTYVQKVLALKGISYVIVAGCLFIGIIIFLMTWRHLIETRGKKRTLLLIFIVAACSLPVSLLGLIPMSSTLIAGIVFTLVIAAVLGGWYLFPYIIYADVAEDDNKTTEELRAGIYAGFPNIILNIFQACGLILLGVITSLPNIMVGAIPPFSIGLVVWGPICSAILIVSWLYTRKYVNLDFKWEKKE